MTNTVSQEEVIVMNKKERIEAFNKANKPWYIVSHDNGRYSYLGGERIEEYIPESEKEAMEFSCEMWEYDSADRNLYLNADLLSSSSQR